MFSLYGKIIKFIDVLFIWMWGFNISLLFSNTWIHFKLNVLFNFFKLYWNCLQDINNFSHISDGLQKKLVVRNGHLKTDVMAEYKTIFSVLVSFFFVLFLRKFKKVRTEQCERQCLQNIIKMQTSISFRWGYLHANWSGCKLISLLSQACDLSPFYRCH